MQAGLNLLLICCSQSEFYSCLPLTQTTRCYDKSVLYVCCCLISSMNSIIGCCIINVDSAVLLKTFIVLFVMYVMCCHVGLLSMIELSVDCG